MLKGKEFGAAIGEAVKLKIEQGKATSKAEIARHFGMKPPSLSDWVKKGSVSKDKLHELWRYFSDVVGPDHWGITQSEWPLGLTGSRFKAAEPEPMIYLKNISDPEVEHLSNIMRQLDNTRRIKVIEFAQDALTLQNLERQNSTGRTGS